jgi:peptidoglycan hydrolase CwlO-like protein
MSSTEYVTKTELKSLFREQTDEILNVFQTFMHQVDERFNAIENHITDLKTSHNTLINTIDGFVGRIDKYETELAACDHKIDRLERWILELSKKTGVKLLP